MLLMPLAVTVHVGVSPAGVEDDGIAAPA